MIRLFPQVRKLDDKFDMVVIDTDEYDGMFMFQRVRRVLPGVWCDVGDRFWIYPDRSLLAQEKKMRLPGSSDYKIVWLIVIAVMSTILYILYSEGVFGQ